MKRVAAIFSGRVQGVGFRFTTVRLAGAYDGLSGYVMNQSDGTVRLVAEGEEDDLRALLDDIRRSRLGRYITDLQTQWRAATGKLRGFEVRYG